MRNVLAAFVYKFYFTLPLSLQGKGNLPYFTDDESQDSKRVRDLAKATHLEVSNQDSNPCLFPSKAPPTTPLVEAESWQVLAEQ